MNDYYDDNRDDRREEPERVQIPIPETPRTEPRPGGGFDTTALIFGILSVLASSCAPPVSLILSVVSFVFLRRYRAAGGEWGGASVAAALLAGLGILFSILAVMLVVYAFVTKDPNSIYGYLYQIEA